MRGQLPFPHLQPEVIGTVPGPITVGPSGQKHRTERNHSAMDAATDVVTITYPITARKADGTDVTLSAVQSITKSKQGSTGTPGTNAPYYEYRYAKTEALSPLPQRT